MTQRQRAFATLSAALMLIPGPFAARGYALTAPDPADFFSLAPCRVIDTRNPTDPLGGPALVAAADRAFPVLNVCGIPSGATAVSVTIAVTGATAAGNLRLHAGGTLVPLVSAVNYSAGQTRSNNAVVPLSPTGELAAFVGAAAGTVHFILDVNGYFAPASTPTTTALALTSGTNPSSFGDPLTFTATVTGPGGTPTGTVTFKDGANAIGSPVALSAGSAVLGISTLSAGSHSLTATYNGDSTYLGSTSTPALTQVVNALPATALVVAGVTTPESAGVAGSFSVTAKDASNNTATGYVGTVNFTSSDGQAVFSPTSYTFLAGDNGVKTGLGVTLKTAGTQSVTATDSVTGTITGSQTAIVVNPSTATVLVVAGVTTPRTAGVAGSFSVTAKDAFNNTATGYLGTVNFTSSDGQAVFSPTSYTFLAVDNGVKTGLGVTLNTAGTQSITATDSVTGAITGSQTGIVVQLGQGELCALPGQCASGSCVDNVCCDTACSGVCAACNLPGSVGTCSPVPDGADPDQECGAVSCIGYYSGWSGDTCRRKADVSAAQATCGGAGACRTAAQECASSIQPGPVTTTCNASCQDPNLSTCTGTIAGSCTNVNPGFQTCGLGVCQVSSPQCVNGAPNACVPNSGAASPETCNDIDDNCDGAIDNGPFQDGYEPNNSCASFTTLPQIGSSQTLTQHPTLYPSGDVDYFRIPAVETDGTCSCCDFFCTDEDFRLTVTLTVPAGAGSYQFCTAMACDQVASNCQVVNAGTSATWTYNLDGSCPAIDSYAVFVRISAGNSPGFECTPYTLSYNFLPGCFGAAPTLAGAPVKTGGP